MFLFLISQAYIYHQQRFLGRGVIWVEITVLGVREVKSAEQEFEKSCNKSRYQSRKNLWPTKRTGIPLRVKNKYEERDGQPTGNEKNTILTLTLLQPRLLSSPFTSWAKNILLPQDPSLGHTSLRHPWGSHLHFLRSLYKWDISQPTFHLK